MMKAIHFMGGGAVLSYPINLELEGQECIVLGGGTIAHRKVRGLLDAGAHVTVIAPEICEQLRRETSVHWLNRRYAFGCLPRGVLFIAATDDAEVNRLAALEAANKHMLVNIVNDPDPIDNVVRFENPSTLRSGKLLLAISTGGTSPALSRLIRQRLENVFNDDFARRLDTISNLRDEVKNSLDDPKARVEFWRNVLREHFFDQNIDSKKLEVLIRNALACHRTQPSNRAD